MSRNLIKNAFAVGVAVLFTAALALADKGRKVDIYTDAVLPDGQTLKAGKYDVHLDEAAKTIEFIKENKLVAKHPCQCVEQPEKNRYNQVIYREGEGKKQVLQELRISGDNKKIILNPPGM